MKWLDDKKFEDLDIEELGYLYVLIDSLPEDVNLYSDTSEGPIYQDDIEELVEELFNTSSEDVKKFYGQAFIEDDSRVVYIKGPGGNSPLCGETEYHCSENEFLYDEYRKQRDGSWKLYENNINYAAEEMLCMAKDGFIYTDHSCGNEWNKWKKLTKKSFESIKKASSVKIEYDE